MRPTKLLQKIRKMHFEETFQHLDITKEETARLLSISSRSFRCYINCYQNGSLD